MVTIATARRAGTVQRMAAPLRTLDGARWYEIWVHPPHGWLVIMLLTDLVS